MSTDERERPVPPPPSPPRDVTPASPEPVVTVDATIQARPKPAAPQETPQPPLADDDGSLRGGARPGQAASTVEGE